jgi:hypothetical protein
MQALEDRPDALVSFLVDRGGLPGSGAGATVAEDR